MRPHFLPQAIRALGFAVLAGLAVPLHASTPAGPPTPGAARLTGTFDGIGFEYSPGQESLVRLLAPRIAEHNRQQEARGSVAPAPPNPEPLSPDDMRVNRTKYLGHIAALLALKAPTALQEECYDEFLRNYALTMAQYDVARKTAADMAIVRRVTLWDRAELVRQLEAGRRIPGFTWDPVKKQGGVTFGFQRDFNDPRLTELAASRKTLHRAYRLRLETHGGAAHYSATVSPKSLPQSAGQPASTPPVKADQTDLFPMIIPPDLAGKPAAEQAEALLSDHSQWADAFRAMDEVEQNIPRIDPTLAYIVLHETTELGIIDRYMRGADRRWFCDGVANYVAWRVIRDLDGTAAAKRVYDLPAQLARYASLRAEADLRRWPAVENESAADQESDLNTARYAYATHAVALMNERAGENILPRLFIEIGKTKPEDTSILTVAAAWRKLTGTPLMGLVEAAIGETPKPGDPAPNDAQLEVIGARRPAVNVDPGFGCEFNSSKSSGRIRQVKVTRVVPGAPADRAGLRVGDRIVAVDGQPLPGKLLREATQVFSFHLASDHPTTIHLRIERGLFRRRLDLQLTLDPTAAHP